MKISRYIVTLSLALFSGIVLVAQNESSNDSLNMDIFVDGELKLFLKDANKLSTWPQPKESLVEMPTIKYTLIPSDIPVKLEPKRIEAAKVKIDQTIPKLYRGYIKAGFGLYTTPLVDVYYADGRSRQGTWGFNYKHLSSAGNVALADSIPDRFSDNEAHIWGERFMKKHALYGRLDWNRNLIHRYGFDPEIFTDAPIAKDSLNQRFNDVHSEVKLTSYHRDSTKFNYEVLMGFANFRDLEESVENNIDIQFHGRTFIGKELYSLDVGVNHDQLSILPYEFDVVDVDKRTLVSAIPKVSTIQNNWKISVGAGIWVDGGGTQPFHFFPLAEAQYSILDDLFIPYVGIKGMMHQNIYRTVAKDNPFILRNFEFRNTAEKLTVHGGIRGTISSSTSFNLNVASTRYDDFLYYVNDSTYTIGNQFAAEYDELGVFRFTGEVSINTTDDFELFIRGDYNFYKPDTEEEAWNQPNTRVSLAGSYTLQDKLVISAELFTEGNRKAKSLVPFQDAQLADRGYYVVDLKGYADANLAVEYRYTKRISAWVRINNFLAAKYARYNPYPVQQFNAMMGASFAF